MGAVTSMVLGGIALAGAATSAAGQYKQGKSAKEAMNYNAQVAEQQGQMAEDSAELEALKLSRNKDRVLGAQRAGYAGSGVVNNTGTPLDVELQSASEAEMDIMIAKWNGKVNKEKAKSQASYDRMLGENYMSAGKAGAVSTLLQSAGTIGLQHFGSGATKTVSK